jgi:putative Holliday junction resolvase
MPEAIKKYLGIDYGSKRIGLAVGDPAVKLAQPLATLDATETELNQNLGDIIASEGITNIVVGLPRNLEGEDTPQTAAARQFGQWLEANFELPVDMQDEALTSEEATKRLDGRNNGKFQPGLVDQESAVIILQDYLDNL